MFIHLNGNYINLEQVGRVFPLPARGGTVTLWIQGIEATIPGCSADEVAAFEEGVYALSLYAAADDEAAANGDDAGADDPIRLDVGVTDSDPFGRRR